MFCPKCGAQLPDTATFCGKCGNELPAKAVGQAKAAKQPAPVQAARAAKPPAARTGGFTPLGIVGRICSVIALIAMFMPWLDVPGMRTLGNYASYLGVKVSGDFTYPMYNMGDVTKTLDTLASSNSFTGIQMLFLVLWVVAIVLLVIGLIRSFAGNKSTGMLLAGGIVAALVAILWFAAVTYLDSEFARQLAQLIGARVTFFAIPNAVWVTFVMGLLGGILGFMGRAKKA